VFNVGLPFASFNVGLLFPIRVDMRSLRASFASLRVKVFSQSLKDAQRKKFTGRSIALECGMRIERGRLHWRQMP